MKGERRIHDLMVISMASQLLSMIVGVWDVRLEAKLGVGMLD